MNKPIIIDGCNVAECENIAIQDGYIGCTDNLVGECEGDNCIYKQLQRLKAENKELKRKNTILELVTEPQRQEIGKYQNKALKLKQALEEVREITNMRNIGCGAFCEVNRLEHNCDAECNAYYLAQIQDKINEVLKDKNY